MVMVRKDTTKLEEEIGRYRALDREKRLDKNGKAKLKDLLEKLSKIHEIKKAHGVNIEVEKGKTAKSRTPIYFHPTLNPSGLPPPGVSVSPKPGDSDEEGYNEEGDEVSTASEGDSSEAEGSTSEDEGKEISDEDIPLPSSPPTRELSSSDELPDLPPGPPPQKLEDKRGSDDDEENNDLPPMPAGPPPARRVEQSFGPSMHPMLRPRPFGQEPPNMMHFGGMQYPPMYPPPFNGAPGIINNARPGMRPTIPPPQAFSPNSGPPSFGMQPPPSTMHSFRPSGHTQLPPPPPRPPQSRAAPFSHYGPPPVPFPHTAPLKPPPAVTSSLPKSKPGTPAPTPVIRAEPQVRNLQKELTTLVPASVLRKKKAAVSKQKASRPLVNAAPRIDDEDGSDNVVPLKRSAAVAEIPVLSGKEGDENNLAETVLTTGGSVGSAAVATGQASAKKTKIRKKVDEYEKFMSEMADLL